MKKTKILYAAFVVSALVVVLSGCSKQEGPAEHAGISIDNAAESVGEHVQNAGEAIKDAAKSENK
jgi:predicted small secreted protein